MEKLKNEIRITPSKLSIREVAPGEDKESSGRTVYGYAIRFDEPSLVLDDWGERFTEIIEPSCVTAEYLQECDIKMTLFHNREMLLARWNKGEGSMRLTVDAEGVAFEFEAPNTAEGDKCLEGIKRGDLSGCSFTFMPKDYTIEEDKDGNMTIRHQQFAWLGEMTIGSDPAYPSTSVNCRELTNKREEKPESREAEIKAEHDAMIAEIEIRKRKMNF